MPHGCQAPVEEVDPELLAKLASMSEDELKAMHLDSKLGADHRNLRSEIEAKEAALLEKKQVLSALAWDLSAMRKAKNAAMETIDEQVTSIQSVLEMNDRFGRQCASLAEEVEEAAVANSQSLADKRAIEGRVCSELAEAQSRLAAQSAKREAAEAELRRHQTTAAPAMAKLSLELMRLSSDTEAKALSHKIWARHMAEFKKELSDLEALVADHAAVDAQTAQCAATAEQIGQLKDRIAHDDDDLARRHQVEKDIVDSGKFAATADGATERSLDSEMDAVRMLLELQRALVADELGEKEAERLTVTRRELTKGTGELLGTLCETSAKALEQLQSGATRHGETVRACMKERETKLMLQRTEREAIEVAHEQRKRFLMEKERQLEVEQKEVEKGRQLLLHQQHKITMMKADVEEVIAAATLRQTKLTAARKAQEDKAAELKQCRKETRAKEESLKLRVASEKEVERAQRGYVSSLEAHLRIEAHLAEHVAGLVSSADAAGGDEAMEAPLGLRGMSVVRANNEAHGKWMATLKERLAQCELAISEVRAELTSFEARADQQRTLLEQQQTAMSHEAAKLKDYEMNLIARLPSGGANGGGDAATLPTKGALSTPYADAHKYLPTRKSVLPLSPDAVAAPADGAKPTEKKSEGRHSLPDKELLSTPYAAAHRYLASAEDMAHKDGATFDKADAEKLSNEIFAEQNNPLYNPDLQVATQSRSWLNSVF